MSVISTSNIPHLVHLELGTADHGPVVVGLHGIAATGRSLRPALCSLPEQGVRVFLPDLLGHGESPWPPELDYSVDDHLAALQRWADKTIGAEPVWLVGCSMGSLLALAWAARDPKRVHGVVAISAPLFKSTSEARKLLARSDAMSWLMLRTPVLAKALCRRICGKTGPGHRVSTARRFQHFLGWVLLRAYGIKKAPDKSQLASLPEVESGLLDQLADIWLHCWESLYRSLLHCIVEYRAWPDLEHLHSARVPIYFLHGDRDSLAPITHIREAATYGNWEVHEYVGATHALALTHAEMLGKQIGQYLTSVQRL